MSAYFCEPCSIYFCSDCYQKLVKIQVAKYEQQFYDSNATQIIRKFPGYLSIGYMRNHKPLKEAGLTYGKMESSFFNSLACLPVVSGRISYSTGSTEPVNALQVYKQNDSHTNKVIRKQTRKLESGLTVSNCYQ